MMEGIWLALCCLSGWLILPTCPLRQYFFVNKPLTWNEAQTYCRQKYTDLATIENTEDMSQVESLLSSSDSKSEVWFGLYSKINWKWSDGFTGRGAEYRSWEGGKPKFKMDFFCVASRGEWYTGYCTWKLPFVCYKGTQEKRQFVAVRKSKSWSDAKKYCRDKYADLATVRNDDENQQLREVVSRMKKGWMGLFSDPELYWSDGSSFSWSDFGELTWIGSKAVLCGSTALERSMGWNLVDCEQRLPFVCHRLSVKRQVVKLRINLEDSSVDLNDPAVREELLKKLQERLKEKGVSGVTLKWREQPDGKVFHKEATGGTSPASQRSSSNTCVITKV